MFFLSLTGKQTAVKAVLSVAPEKEVQRSSSVARFHFHLLADDSLVKEQKSPFCLEETVEGTFFFLASLMRLIIPEGPSVLSAV